MMRFSCVELSSREDQDLIASQIIDEDEQQVKTGKKTDQQPFLEDL